MDGFNMGGLGLLVLAAGYFKIKAYHKATEAKVVLHRQIQHMTVQQSIRGTILTQSVSVITLSYTPLQRGASFTSPKEKQKFTPNKKMVKAADILQCVNNISSVRGFIIQYSYFW